MRVRNSAGLPLLLAALIVGYRFAFGRGNPLWLPPTWLEVGGNGCFSR